MPAVAFGYGDGIHGVGGYGREAHLAGRARGSRGEPGGRQDEGAGAKGDSAGEDAAAGHDPFDDAVEVGLCRPGGVDLLELVDRNPTAVNLGHSFLHEVAADGGADARGARHSNVRPGLSGE